MDEMQYTIDLLTAQNKKFQKTEKMYRQIADTSSDAILYYSYEDQTFKNLGKWDSFFDFRVETIADLNRVYDAVDDSYQEKLRDLVLSEELPDKDSNHLICGVNNGKCWYDFSLVDFCENNVRLARILRVSNVTKDHEKRAELSYLAYYDNTTGLMNKMFFVSNLGGFVRRASEEHACVSIMMIDIDNFKRINDGIGIIYGDELIQVFGGILRSFTNDRVIASHFGEDHFFMAIYDPCGDCNADSMYRAIREKLSTPIRLTNGRLISVSVSVGVAEYPESTQNALDLIKNAEISMMYVKEVGKDNVRYFDEQVSKQFKDHIELEQLIKEAMRNETFELYYQPQYFCYDRKLRGAEALIRMRDREGVMHFPADFISVAESSGLMRDIGDWVIRDSFKSWSEWKKKYHYPMILSINISVAQLQGDDLIERMQQHLKKFEIDPAEVELEVTESVLIDDTQRIISRLERLRNMGFKISIDDFGTGFSSLSYLKDMPANALKIDKSFLDTLLQDQSTQVITETMVYLSKKLDLVSIAEGVETEKQFEYIRRMGVDVVQGYLMSKPVPKAELEKLIQHEESYL